MNAAPAEHPTRVLGPGHLAAVALLTAAADQLADRGHHAAAEHTTGRALATLTPRPQRAPHRTDSPMNTSATGAAVRHLDSAQALTGAQRGALSELLLTLDRARHTGPIPVSVALTLDRVVPVLAERPANTPAIPAEPELADDERAARRDLGERVRAAAPSIRTAVPGQLGRSLAVALSILGGLVAEHPGPLGLLPYHLGRIAQELDQQPAEVTE